MSIPATNRSLFDQSSEDILARALNSMTLACDALTKENHQLREQVVSLTAEVARLKEQVVLNP
jgi:cell division protein FtsB